MNRLFTRRYSGYFPENCFSEQMCYHTYKLSTAKKIIAA